MFNPEELQEVRLGACGCVLSADLPAVGFRFVRTALGDVRQPVFACPEHTRFSPPRVTKTRKARAEKG